LERVDVERREGRTPCAVPRALKEACSTLDARKIKKYSKRHYFTEPQVGPSSIGSDATKPTPSLCESQNSLCILYHIMYSIFFSMGINIISPRSIFKIPVLFLSSTIAALTSVE